MKALALIILMTIALAVVFGYTLRVRYNQLNNQVIPQHNHQEGMVISDVGYARTRN